jgi:sugar lactone lactonase YvrE
MSRLLFGLLACWLAFVSSSTGPLAAAATSIPFEEGEPASVLWDAATHTLVIADNERNQLWTWSDAGGLKKLATLPDPLDAAAAKATLVGQAVRLTDGTLVVMRFGKPGGSSSFGGIAFVNPATGAGGVVPNVDPARKRIGLAVAADGRLFGSYFAGMPGGGQAGAVTRIDLETGEQDFAPGFKKIVGLAVVGDALFVSDQLADAIYELPLNGPLPAPGAYKVFATLPRPDQLTPGPDGSLFTGQFQAAPGWAQSLAVRQILRDGTVKIVAEDPDVTRPSGVAYDAEGRRLFVANGGNPAQRFVRIIPIP